MGNEERNEKEAQKAFEQVCGIVKMFAGAIAGEEDSIQGLKERLGYGEDDPFSVFEAIGNYGLSFEYDDDDGGFRWVLCTGGPHWEIRFYCTPSFRFRDATFLYSDWWYSKEMEFPREVLRGLELLWDCEFSEPARYLLRQEVNNENSRY